MREPTRQRGVMAAFCAAARSGAPCPTNEELTDWGRPADAVAVVNAIERKGLIRVERRPSARRVQILATGEWTGWTARGSGGRQPIRQAEAVIEAEDGVRMTAAEIAARRVDREACPRCGVRADRHDLHGCGRFARRELSTSGRMGLNHG